MCELVAIVFPDPGTTLRTVGLVFDICGVVFVFKYGLPEPLSREGSIYLILEQTDEAEKAKARKYDIWARVGLWLLLIGFILQLFGNYF
jgi:hypothetical protein